jgi:hypothetical protein
MKRKPVVVLMLGLAMLLSACDRGLITPHAQTATPVPEFLMTRVPSSPISIIRSTATNTPLPPTDTPTPTLVPSLTTTMAATLTLVRSSPTPTSTGSLSVAVYVVGCRNAPTPEKPGNIVVQISIDASGGNGVYRYFMQGIESPGKFADIEWERGSRLIGQVKVISGDGQIVEKKYDIVTGELDCK